MCFDCMKYVMIVWNMLWLYEVCYDCMKYVILYAILYITVYAALYVTLYVCLSLMSPEYQLLVSQITLHSVRHQVLGHVIKSYNTYTTSTLQITFTPQPQYTNENTFSNLPSSLVNIKYMRWLFTLLPYVKHSAILQFATHFILTYC